MLFLLLTAPGVTQADARLSASASLPDMELNQCKTGSELKPPVTNAQLDIGTRFLGALFLHTAPEQESSASPREHKGSACALLQQRML